MENIIANGNFNIILLLPILTFILVNMGFLSIGILFLIYKWFQNKKYPQVLALTFFILLSPLIVNTLDVRLPTLVDVVINAVAVFGILSLITNIKQLRYKVIITFIFMLSILPGIISLTNRNNKLSIRSSANWYDRAKAVKVLINESKITDIYLWKIKKVDESTVFIPIEIGEYYFWNLQDLKSDTRGIMENSYAFLGRNVKL